MQAKSKISLSNYQYKHDIEGRIFISQLSSSEIHILRELINQSTKFTILELAESAEVDLEDAEAMIDKCSQTGLVLRQNQNVFVNKEIRKYFELHIHKFDPVFYPCFDFIRKLLNRLPVSLLPNWYDLPKTSDNIFESILEKYAHTPKTYGQYINGLTFDNLVINSIVRDVLSSTDLQIPTEILRERYSLSKEKLQEYILLLEFHLIMISSFKKEEDRWIEVLTPIYEWQKFIKIKQSKTPTPIAESDIELLHAASFSQEEVFGLYRKSIDALQDRWNSTFGPIERTIRRIQKRLSKLPRDSWFFVDDFADSLLLPIGNQPPIHLKNVGKKWDYCLPSYTEAEHQFVQSIILDLLFETGIVSCGHTSGKLCFKVTPFGYVSMSE